jgi:hypothetical protein
MNRIITFSIFTLIQTVSFSQITLTSADFAADNDTVRMSRTTDNAIDFASTGPNYTWNFSSLTPEEQLLREFTDVSNAGTFAQFLFGFFAPANYQATYFLPSIELPLAQITSFLPITIEDVFQYTKKSNTAVSTVGYSMNVTFSGTTTNVPFQSDTIETRYVLPLTAGQSYASSGYTRVDFNPIYDAQWVQYRQRNTTVDGFGSITTPLGTFDALRLHHIVDELDSIYLVLPVIGGNWLPLTIPTVHEYEWWGDNQKEPLLRIRTSELGGNETVTLIEYRDLYRPEFASLIEEEQTNLQIYPNPSADFTLIESNNPIIEVSMSDASGRFILRQQAFNQKSLVLDLTTVENGAYWLTIRTENGVEVKSIVKQ